MPTYTVCALVEGCFLQAPLQLTPELQVEMAGTLAGLSQREFMRQFTEKETKSQRVFVPDAQIVQAWQSAQVVALFKRKNVQADSPQEAEAKVTVELDRAVRLLSLITGNAGRIFGLLLLADDASWVKLVTPRVITRLRLGFGNTGTQYEAMLRGHFEKALRHPRLALLYSLLYETNAEANWEFKFLKLYTLLDVASAHISVSNGPVGSSESAERIKELFRKMNVSLSMQAIDASWSHSGT